MFDKKKNVIEELKEEIKQESKEKKEAQLVEVPTGSRLAFMLEDESIITLEELLIKIYNDVQKIKKEVVA